MAGTREKSQIMMLQIKVSVPTVMLDNVELVFEDEALKAVAKKAQEQPW